MFPFIDRIGRREDLNEEQAQALADGFFDGTLDEPAMRAALTGLNAKGIAVDELVGFARSMKTHSIAIHPGVEVVDTCGTGGDGKHTFNISTASALLASACGVRVAKHGNRSQSSRTGSADVLEALGIPIDLPPASTASQIKALGFGFLYAPQYHPAMKRVAPVRKALGVKTIFNMLGPLTNPANPSAQVIGTYSVEAQEKMAQAAARLGIRRAFVLHGEGNDEAGLSRTRVLDVNGKELSEFLIEPNDYGIHVKAEELQVGDAKESATKIRMAFSDADRLESRVVCLNAALALIVAGKAATIKQGFALAQEAVETGKAMEKLGQLTEASQP